MCFQLFIGKQLLMCHLIGNCDITIVLAHIHVKHTRPILFNIRDKYAIWYIHPRVLSGCLDFPGKTNGTNLTDSLWAHELNLVKLHFVIVLFFKNGDPIRSQFCLCAFGTWTKLWHLFRFSESNWEPKCDYHVVTWGGHGDNLKCNQWPQSGQHDCLSVSMCD